MRKNIVSFSGGKDSTAMLLMMLERDVPVDEIVFVDTTKEFPEMHEHIRAVESFINRKITILKIDFDYWFSDHVKIKGKNKGQKGYGWPDHRNRWCTALKRDAIKRYLRQFNSELITEFHGIAFDELKRTLNNPGRNIQYPLVDWKITEQQALDYCYSKGFNWGDLYEKFSRVSCYCCPLSRLGELKRLLADYPDLWGEMRRLDRKSKRQFRSDYSLAQLECKFQGFLERKAA